MSDFRVIQRSQRLTVYYVEERGDHLPEGISAERDGPYLSEAAAWAAARDRQNKRLTDMLTHAIRRNRHD